MTLTAVPAALPIPIASLVFDAPDPDFQRRWQEWKAGGRAHEQATRRRAVICDPGASLSSVLRHHFHHGLLAALVTVVLSRS